MKILLSSLQHAAHEFVDCPGDGEYEEEGEEAHYAVHYIGEIHAAATRDALTDFYGEDYYQNDGKDVQKSDHNCVVIFC